MYDNMQQYMAVSHLFFCPIIRPQKPYEFIGFLVISLKNNIETYGF